MNTITNTGGSATVENGLLSISGIDKLQGSLVSALNLDELSVEGNSVFSSLLSYTINSIATTDTLFSDLGISGSNLAFSVYSSTGDFLAAYTLSSNATIQNLFDKLLYLGLEASIDDSGSISILNGFITGNLANKLGLSHSASNTCVASTSILSNPLAGTTTTSATMTSSLASLGLSTNQYLTIVNGSTTIKATFSTASTIQSIADKITAAGGSFILDDNQIIISGVDSISGSLLSSLGLQANSVNGTTVYSSGVNYTVGSIATEASKFSDFGISVANKAFNVYSQSGELLASNLTLASSATISDLFALLQSYGLDTNIDSSGSIVISNGYISGDLPTVLGISTSSYNTIVANKSLVSTAILASTYTTASLDTTLAQLGIAGTQYLTINYNGTISGFNFNANSTLADIKDAINSAGGSFSLENGYISAAYVDISGNLATSLGFNKTQGSVQTITTTEVQFTVSTITITSTATATAITTSTAIVTLTLSITATNVNTSIEDITITTVVTTTSTVTVSATTTAAAAATAVAAVTAAVSVTASNSTIVTVASAVTISSVQTTYTTDTIYSTTTITLYTTSTVTVTTPVSITQPVYTTSIVTTYTTLTSKTTQTVYTTSVQTVKTTTTVSATREAFDGYLDSVSLSEVFGSSYSGVSLHYADEFVYLADYLDTQYWGTIFIKTETMTEWITIEITDTTTKGDFEDMIEMTMGNVDWYEGNLLFCSEKYTVAGEASIAYDVITNAMNEGSAPIQVETGETITQVTTTKITHTIAKTTTIATATNTEVACGNLVGGSFSIASFFGWSEVNSTYKDLDYSQYSSYYLREYFNFGSTEQKIIIKSETSIDWTTITVNMSTSLQQFMDAIANATEGMIQVPWDMGSVFANTTEMIYIQLPDSTATYSTAENIASHFSSAYLTTITGGTTYSTKTLMTTVTTKTTVTSTATTTVPLTTTVTTVTTTGTMVTTYTQKTIQVTNSSGYAYGMEQEYISSLKINGASSNGGNIVINRNGVEVATFTCTSTATLQNLIDFLDNNGINVDSQYSSGSYYNIVVTPDENCMIVSTSSAWANVIRNTLTIGATTTCKTIYTTVTSYKTVMTTVTSSTTKETTTVTTTTTTVTSTTTSVKSTQTITTHRTTLTTVATSSTVVTVSVTATATSARTTTTTATTAVSDTTTVSTIKTETTTSTFTCTGLETEATTCTATASITAYNTVTASVSTSASIGITATLTATKTTVTVITSSVTLSAYGTVKTTTVQKTITLTASNTKTCTSVATTTVTAKTVATNSTTNSNQNINTVEHVIDARTSVTTTTTIESTVTSTKTTTTTATVIKTTTEKTASTYIDAITTTVTKTSTESLVFRSNQKTYGITTTSFNAADTKLSQLGITNGTIRLTNTTTGTITNIYTITANSTLSDFIAALELNGYNAEFADGRLSLTTNENISLVANGTNALTKLNFSTATDTVTYTKNSTSNQLNNLATHNLSGTVTLGAFTTTAAERVLELEINGEKHYKTFSASNTVNDIISYLNSQGITASINNGTFSASCSDKEFSLGGSLGNTLIGSNPTVTTTSKTASWSAELGNSINGVTINGNTKLVDLDVSEGSIKIYDNGTYIDNAINISNTTTINDLIASLQAYGFSASLNNGTLQISTTGDKYLVNESSNLVSKLGLNKTYTYDTVFTSSTSTTLGYSKTYTITASTSLNDMGYNDGAELRLSVDGTLYSIAFSGNETVNDIINTLNIYGINASINNGTFTASSSEHTFTLGGEIGNILLGNSPSVNSITTVTGYTAELNDSVNNVTINENTKLVDLGVSQGGLKIYDNGTWINTAVSIDDNTTISDLITALNGYGLTMTLQDGKLIVTSDSDKYLADEASNLVSKLGLTTRNQAKVNVYDQTNSNTLTIVTTFTTDASTTLRDLGFPSGASLRLEIGGVMQTIGFTADETVQDVIDSLASYSIDAKIENGIFSASSSDKTFKLTGTLAEKLNGAAPTYLTTEKVLSYQSEPLSHDVEYIADNNTKLTDLDVSTGYVNILRNGEIITTVAIEENTTLSQFFSALSAYGVAANISPSGKITIQSIGDVTLSDGTSNLVSKFGLDDNIRSCTYEGTTMVLEDEVNLATEDTLISYFDTVDKKALGSLYFSLYDQDGNLSNNVVNIEENDTIGDVINKLQKIGLTVDFKDGVLSYHYGLGNAEITGGSSSLVDTLQLNNTALEEWLQNPDEITIVEDEIRYLSIVNYADNNTNMQTLGVTSGDLSIGINGAIVTVSIDENDTIQNVISRISSASHGSVTASLTSDGKFNMQAAAGVELIVGTSTDTTNLATIFNLIQDGSNVITGGTSLYKASSSSKITENGIFRLGDVSEGTFTIGNAVFTITNETTIASLINEINRNEAANASAYWDNINGKMVLTSNALGAAYVNVQAGSSNISEIFGLTTNDNGIEKLATYNQKLGDNAILTINGTRIVATSNTITSDISRIEGLTVNIKDVTAGEYVTITVERDTQGIIDAVQESLDAYNTLIAELNTALSVSGNLHGDVALNGIKNQIASILTSRGTNGTSIFRNLAAVGISTEAASSVLTSDIYSLYLDNEKFSKALEESENDVKLLLVGTVDNPGILTRVENILENALSSAGYFSTKNAAINRDIANYDKKIAKANAQAESYKALLERKFSNMELLYSSMQSNYSNILSANVA